MVEWSEVFFQRGMRRHVQTSSTEDEMGREEGEEGEEKVERFGIEQAAEACSLEVSWQTQKWGEVEDTHDVEKEDLRRQFGSVVLVVGGTGTGNGGGDGGDGGSGGASGSGSERGSENGTTS